MPANDLLETIFENTDTRIAYLDLDLKFLCVNRAFATVEKKEADFFVGKLFSDLFPDEKNKSILQRVIETGESYRNYARPFDPETALPVHGDHYDWNVSPTRDAGKLITGLLLQLSDASERIQAEEESMQERPRFQSLLQKMPAGIFQTNASGSCIYTNLRYQKITGMSESEALGDGWREFIHRDDWETVMIEWEASVEENRPFAQEYRFEHCDGRVVWVSGEAIAERNSQGEIISFIGSIIEISKNKEVELENQRMGSIVKNSPNFIGISEIDGTPLFLNEAGKRMVGIRDDAHLMKIKVLEYFPDRYQELLKNDIIPSLMSEEGRWKGEVHFRHFQNGPEIPVWFDIFRIDDAKTGQPMNFATITKDISERKESEKELREASELNAKIISESPIGIGLYEFDGQCKATNQALANIIGASQEQILAQNFYNIQSWQSTGLLDVVKMALEDRQAKQLELNFLTGFGKRVYIEVYIVPILFSGRAHLMLLIDDIGDRMIAEKAFKESERLLKEAQHVAHLGYIDWNPITNDISWSEETYRIYGIPPDQKPDFKYTIDMVHPDDRERVIAALNVSIETLTNFDMEHRIVRKDGIVVYLHAKGELNMNENGQVVRMLGTVIDITERKKNEAELERYRLHLEELVEERTLQLRNAQDELVRKSKLATLGQLTATVSHELRNPLAAMLPSLYTIQMRSDPHNQPVQRSLKRLHRSVNRCDHIIDELLDFTRIKDLDLQPVLLDAWLKSVIEEQCPPDGITVTQNLDLAGMVVSIDSDRLRRVIINIHDNACQAMTDEGTRKTIQNAHLEFKSLKNGERIEIHITDSGSGIPADVLPRVFEPLFSTKGFGVGLGMPIIKQIIEEHGGGIELQTKEKIGTTVTLWLPLVPKVSSQSQTGARRTSEGGS